MLLVRAHTRTTSVPCVPKLNTAPLGFVAPVLLLKSNNSNKIPPPVSVDVGPGI